MPSIVGGLDIHRKQITFDYLDLATGEVGCGQVAPADRAHLRAWLARFEHPGEVAFAVEACTGWRYVTGELQRAGMEAHLAEPAGTAAARGRKRRAKTDRADARLQRDLLIQDRLPECWIPPEHVLECRALLELYHDLRAEHTAWVQRVHAVLFHQGAPVFHDLSRAGAPAELAELAREHLSPAGQCQVGTCLRMCGALEAELTAVRRRVIAAARHLRGAKVLAESIYGVGPVTALALTCWLGGAGRFSSARKAVRFAGLDITVYSSDGKRSPGTCPGRDRRCCAGRCMRRVRPMPAPSRPITATTPQSRTARTASALPCPRPARSSAGPATSCPSSATTRSPWCERCPGLRSRRR
jgi:transposase